ncbi:MAG: peptide ABC transporter substrate-binding protein [Janthinobacterium lividum]
MARPARTVGLRLLAGAAAAVFALLGAGIRADAAGACGTLVIPTGLGVGPPTAAGSLHPVLSPGSLYDQESFNQLYRPMLWFQPDHAIDWSLSHASSIDVEDGGRTYVITLKPITWSDGVAVTADDLVYGFELMKQLGPTYSGYDSGGMPKLFQAVEAEDPLTLRVTLTQAVNPEWFELSGLGQLYALPRHAWGRYSVDEQRSLQTDAGFLSVVDGPFRLVEFNSGRYEALAPNPSYAGPQAQVERLVIDFLQGTSPLEALRAGELDAANLPFNVYDAARAIPGLALVKLPPQSGYESIVVNMRNPDAPFLADARVRQAIADAVNQDEVIHLAFHDSTVPVRSPVPPVPATFLSEDARAGRFPTGYDPAHARALLAQAGFTPGPDGILQKDGRRLEWTDLLSDAATDLLVEWQVVQANLLAIGIRMNIRLMQFNQIIALMDRDPSGWQTASIGWSFPNYPDMQINYGTGAGENYGHFSDPETDALLKQVQDQPGREALFRLQDHLAALQPFIIMPQGAYSLLVRPGVEGLGDALQANYLWALQKIHFSGERACDAQAAR